MRCRLIGLLVAGAALALLPSGEVPAAGGFLVFLGQKQLDDDDWQGSGDHNQIGLLCNFGADDWPVLIAADLLWSFDEADAVPGAAALDQFSIELDLGVRKMWRHGRTRPFLGGGLAFIRGGRDLLALPGLVLDDSDSGTGFWADGGVVWQLNGKFHLGLEARYSRAEIELEREIEAGGRHVGIVLGSIW